MSSSNNNMYEFKVVLLGCGGVGKSAYITRLTSGEFTPRYTPTLGVVVHPVCRYASTGDSMIQFNIWNCAGQERFSRSHDNYLHEADAVIIMMDERRFSSKSADQDGKYVKTMLGVNVPIVYVRNKCELGCSDGIINISVKNNINLDEPFVQLAQQLVDPHYTFGLAPTVSLPEALV